MSAWIVSKAHIDLLVQALATSEVVVDRHPDDIGRVLWRECLTSVAYRYPGDGDGERPGPIDFRDSMVDTYTYEPFAANLPSHSFILTQLRCYDYQSCEHPGYEHSQARKWISDLESRLESAGAQSKAFHTDEAGVEVPWGVDEAHRMVAGPA